jgi:hypothetical protein
MRKKVKELEATLGTAKQIKKFEDDIEELRKDNQERRKENIEWKDMMNAVKDSGSEWEKLLHETIQKLKAEAFDQTTLIDFELRPEIERLRRNCSEFKSIDDGIQTIDEVEERLSSAEYISNLREQIRGLQRKSDAEKELLEVGTAVRLLCLEQNSDAEVAKIRGNGNQLTPREGNATAHNGNGAADVALFQMEVLKETSELAKVFEGSYDRTPGEYLEWPKLLRRVVDSTVTMRTFKKINHGHEARYLRARRSEIEKKLIESWNAECSETESP